MACNYIKSETSFSSIDRISLSKELLITKNGGVYHYTHPAYWLFAIDNIIVSNYSIHFWLQILYLNSTPQSAYCVHKVICVAVQPLYGMCSIMVCACAKARVNT